MVVVALLCCLVVVSSGWCDSPPSEKPSDRVSDKASGEPHDEQRRVEDTRGPGRGTDAAPSESFEESAASTSKVVMDEASAEVSEELPQEPASDRTPRTLYERLTPRQQIRAVAGLASVLLLGVFLLFAVWAGARFTRSYLRAATPDRSQPSGQDLDDWARKPLVPHDESDESSL